MRAVDVARLEPEASTIGHIDHNIVGPIVLAVLPFAEGGGADTVVAAFHLLVTYLRPDAYLIVAGGGRDIAAYRRLDRFALELRLDRVWLAVDPAPATVAAFVARAAVVIETADVNGLAAAPLAQWLADRLPPVAPA